MALEHAQQERRRRVPYGDGTVHGAHQQYAASPLLTRRQTRDGAAVLTHGERADVRVGLQRGGEGD